MSDPFPADSLRAPDAPLDADRDAKIEQLLLVGLDHYFAGQHEQAINVWTRALFLDRSHARARAYIERARSALAERQRRSEELLHSGSAAFDRGDGTEARRLLEAAIDGGAPADEARALIDRLDRLERPAGVREPRSPRATASVRRRPEASTARRLSQGLALVAAVAIGATLVVVALVGGWDWRAALGSPLPGPRATAPPIVREQGLPLPRHGETALVRARALAAGGHVHEAIDVLAAVRPTDPQRAEADRLRGDLQRQLLASAQAGSREKARGRQP